MTTPLGGLLYVTEVSPYRPPPGAPTPAPAGVHHGLPSSVMAVEELAGLCGLSFVHASSVAGLSEERLRATKVLVLSTIGETPWSGAQRHLVEERWRAGDLGIVGLHSATDASYDWAAYGDMLGGRFDGHPMTADLKVAVVDQDHPATAHLSPVWPFRDELYLFRALAEDLHVLLAVRMGPVSSFGPGEGLATRDLPLAWCRTLGPARSFYSALGHFTAAWEDAAYLRHVLGGIRWVLGGGPGGSG